METKKKPSNSACFSQGLLHPASCRPTRRQKEESLVSTVSSRAWMMEPSMRWAEIKTFLSYFVRVRLQQYMNWELPDVQAGFRKGRGTRGQISNIHWVTEKAREFQKSICFIDYAKAFHGVDHNKLWKILKEMGIPDHLPCLLKNLYAGQEVTEPDMEQ